MRIILLLMGFLMIFVQQNVSSKGQIIIFFVGIILLGIPHGAADLLVATQNADSKKRIFSSINFFVNYLGRLIAFAAILWFFPLIGNISFIFLAAYHFGETDLYKFKTNTFSGKLLVLAYGLVILSVILLPHFEEVRPIFQLFKAGSDNLGFINWLDLHRNSLIFSSGILLFASVFVYFLKNKITNWQEIAKFLFQFVLILLILYKLPMLLGFTFYFVVWHSMLSLKNIIGYLRKNNFYSFFTITKQIVFYSILAISGVIIFGLSGFMFMNNNSMMAYSFLGLAVLTAPHMQIMHNMYNSIRTNRAIEI